MAEVRAPAAAAFDDWPASASLGASGITELAAPENPASPMRWSATARTVSAGEMGICIASTTSRRMRSDSRRASSTRPAPWRPRFSLRFAARGRLTARPLARPPVRRRRRSDPYRDRQASSRVLPAPAHAPAAPHGSTTGSARTTWATRAGSWPRSLPGPRPEEAAGAGRAAPSPDAPHHYDSHFWTDGEHVYRWPGDQPVPRRRHSDFPAGHARQRHGLGVLHGWTTGLATAPWWGRARTGA